MQCRAWCAGTCCLCACSTCWDAVLLLAPCGSSLSCAAPAACCCAALLPQVPEQVGLHQQGRITWYQGYCNHLFVRMPVFGLWPTTNVHMAHNCAAGRHWRVTCMLAPPTTHTHTCVLLQVAGTCGLPPGGATGHEAQAECGVGGDGGVQGAPTRPTRHGRWATTEHSTQPEHSACAFRHDGSCGSDAQQLCSDALQATAGRQAGGMHCGRTQTCMWT